MEHMGHIWKISDVRKIYGTYRKYMENRGNIKTLWDTYQNLWEIWDFPYMDVPLNGGFIVENPLNMDAN